MSYDSNNDFFSNTTYNVTEANDTSIDPTLLPDYHGHGNIHDAKLVHLSAKRCSALGRRRAKSE